MAQTHGARSGWPEVCWYDNPFLHLYHGYFYAWTFIFVVWLDFPIKSRRKIFIHRIVQFAGLMALVWLAVVLRDSSGMFRTSWWGTLGKVGWTYLFASLTFLIVRNNRAAIIGIFVLIYCAYLGIMNGLFRDNRLVEFLGTSTIGSYLPCAIAGLTIGTLLIEEVGYMKIVRWVLGLGALHRLCVSDSLAARGLTSSLYKLVSFLNMLRFGNLCAALLVHRHARMGKRTGLCAHYRKKLSSSLPAYTLLDMAVLAHSSGILRYFGRKHSNRNNSGCSLHPVYRYDYRLCGKKARSTPNMTAW